MRPEEITEKLVEFRTTQARPEEIRDSLDFVEEFFEDEKFHIRKFESNGTPSLLISYRETLTPEILLHGHIDVVSAEDELFRPRKENGKIYGRGTADMKSGLACCMKLLKDMDPESTGEGLALLVTADEEVGGFNGTGYMVEQGLEPDFVISAEPDDSGSFPSIVTRQKGVLQMMISTEGRSAHGSKPDKGLNAADKLIEKYLVIRDFFPDGDFATTVNLGRIEGGEEVNKIPENAELHLDIRYSETYPKAEVLEDIRSVEGIEVEVTAEAPMMKVRKDNHYVRGLSEAIYGAGGGKSFRKENFASDMRFFTSRGIPAVCFGPEGYNLHAEDEYVESESMDVYCEILKNFLESQLY